MLIQPLSVEVNKTLWSVAYMPKATPSYELSMVNIVIFQVFIKN